jgi:uncharacterized protein YbjT (DUF2867 family)
LVVKELLRRNTNLVVAIVRDEAKAKEVFPTVPANLKIVKCDLTSEIEIETTLKGVDAAIWCATGFSDSPKVTIIEKIKRLFGAAVMPKKSIDAVGVPAFAKCLNQAGNGGGADDLPKLVMLSSAGVTRPIWDAAMKEKFVGAADIPIVRLNPFGILDIKRESEEKLRRSGTPYCIVRPCGLNDNWPAGSRPVFSQGDVAVGRINRADVADVLVDALTQPEATGKTFEILALSGYPKAVSIGPVLARLVNDKEQVSMETIAASYRILQQLLPGEQQASADLAMGQSYEQLDKGETGRLGERGKEQVEGAGLQPSS